MPLFQVTTIKTYLPLLDHNTLTPFSSHSDLFKACPSLLVVSSLIKRSSPIGRVGNYEGVYEFNIGFEAFTPLSGAEPALGEIGIETITPCVELQTFAEGSVPESIVHKFLLELDALHPWELPIIHVNTGGVSYFFRSKNIISL
jgi:hypothetical protein